MEGIFAQLTPYSLHIFLIALLILAMVKLWGGWHLSGESLTNGDDRECDNCLHVLKSDETAVCAVCGFPINRVCPHCRNYMPYTNRDETNITCPYCHTRIASAAAKVAVALGRMS
jgi:hypothetical protein